MNWPWIVFALNSSIHYMYIQSGKGYIYLDSISCDYQNIKIDTVGPFCAFDNNTNKTGGQATFLITWE